MDNCEDCNLNIPLHCVNYYKNDDKALEFFKSHGIIPNSVICPICSNNCRFSPANNKWFCKKRGKMIVVEKESVIFMFLIIKEHF